jgi:hypothetical protein
MIETLIELPSLKRCAGPCGKILPISDFHLKGKGKYYRNRCRNCWSEWKKDKRWGPDGLRICIRCSTRKPANQFSKDSQSLDGLNETCKTCNKIVFEEWGKRNWELAQTTSASCKACGKEFTLIELGARRSDPRIVKGYCKPCRKQLSAIKKRETERKHWHLKRLKGHGLTVQQYDQVLATQKYACACCGDKFTESLRPCIDHCHKTGVIRGLLCHPCNVAEGFLKTINRARKMVRYMENNGLFYGSNS